MRTCIQPASCDACGNPLRGRNTRSRFGDFCSDRCRVKTWKRLKTRLLREGDRKCEVCGESLEGKRIDAKYCDDNCRNQRAKVRRIERVLQEGR